MRRLFLAAALAISFVSPAQAADAPTWRAVDAETGKIASIAALEQLARDFPDSGSVRLRLFNAQLSGDDVEGAMASLEWLYDRGYVFSEKGRVQIKELLAGVDPGRVAERLRADARIVEASRLIATAPAELGLAESVLRDPVDDRLIVTSVSKGAVFGRRAGRGWDRVGFMGVVNISGIALAPGSRTIWLAAGVIDGSQNENGFRGLIGMDHAKNQEIRIEAPDGVSISDITANEGDIVFGSDPLGGGIYRFATAMGACEELIAPGTFRSPQGLAVSKDGKRLYVSDYRYGIAIVDLESRKVSRLGADVPVLLDGVDGLWRFGNELVAVQNGASPKRIVAFKLSDDGKRVVSQRILEQANPEWSEPLSGSLDGDQLLYVGNGQWDRFRKGQLIAGKKLEPTEIRALPLK